MQFLMIVSSITVTSLPAKRTMLVNRRPSPHSWFPLTQNSDALTLDTVFHHSNVMIGDWTSFHTSPRADLAIPSNDRMKDTTGSLKKKMKKELRKRTLSVI